MSLCPTLPSQGTLWKEWLPPRNWEPGCMCGHAGWPGPLPPHGQLGGLLIRRDGFQSHGVPLIKQTSISWWPEGSGRSPVLGGAHNLGGNTEAAGSGQDPPNPPPNGSPHQGIWAAAVHRAGEGGLSLRSLSPRLEPHPACSLLCPLSSPT